MITILYIVHKSKIMKSNGLVEGMDMANLGYSTLQVNISMSAKICVFFYGQLEGSPGLPVLSI